MALRKEPFVKETTDTLGIVDYVLNGAVTDFQAFSILDDGDTFDYTARLLAEFEAGRGRYNSGPDSITRLEVYNSTNGDAAVNWGSGTKDISMTYNAAQAITKDEVFKLTMFIGGM